MAKVNFNVFNSQKNADDGAFLHIAHPVTGEPCYSDEDEEGNEINPIRIKMMGGSSTVAMRKLESDYNRLRAEEANKKSKKDVIEELDLDDKIKRTAEKLAALTLDWENIEHEGAALEFSYKNALMLFTTYAEIRFQAEEFINEKVNFIKG